MQMDDFANIDPNEDLTQILPIQQKRTIAFINYFIMKTVSFINKFAQSCESRLMEFDNKMQKLEASLLILESQLSSIPGLDSVTDTANNNIPDKVLETVESSNVSLVTEDTKVDTDIVIQNESENENPTGIKAKDDPRFVKFFKMLQFGVPEPAVKIKMRNEGLDPNILDKPNEVIPETMEK